MTTRGLMTCSQNLGSVVRIQKHNKGQASANESGDAKYMPTFNNANRRLASLVFILFARQNNGDVDDIEYIEFFSLSISLVRQTCEFISLFLSL